MISITGFTACRTEKGRISLKLTEDAMASGTANRVDKNVTIALPKIIARDPNSAGSPEGYHRILVKNSPMPRNWKNGNASLAM